MTALFDTNVIIAILNPAEANCAWGRLKLEEYQSEGAAIIPDIVYCELAAGMPQRGDLDKAIYELRLQRYNGDDEALHNAGQAFMRYRQNGGRRDRILPDFIVGALAQSAGVPLVTANVRDFVTYFPGIQLVCPT